MSTINEDEAVASAQDKDTHANPLRIWDWYPTVEIAPIGVFRTTPDGRFSYVNQELAKIFEFDSAKQMRDEVKDIAAQLLVKPEQRVHFKTVLEQNGIISDFIYDIKTKRNSIKQAALDARLIKTSDGLMFYEGFLVDVTEQYETKLRLENLLRDVQGMAYRCETKPPWRMMWLSAGCGELTGYSQDALLTNAPAYENLIQEEYREQVADAVAEALKTKTTYTLSYPIRTANQEVKWVLEKGKAVWGPDGKPMWLEGFITSANRITNVSTGESREIEARKEFQKLRFRAVLLWTFIIQFIAINLAVVIILVLKATGQAANVGEATLLGLTGQTVAQVAGLIYIVAKYFFTTAEEGRPTTPTHLSTAPPIPTKPPEQPPAQRRDLDEERDDSFESEHEEDGQKKKGKKPKLPQKG
jgi:PAS domain-containing protein